MKPRKFGNIVKMRLENEKIPYSPMLNHAEQIIIDSLKKYRRNANFMSTYMFSDSSECDGIRILSVRWVQDGVNATWPP